MRLIDADALINELHKEWENCEIGNATWTWIREVVRDQPSVPAVPRWVRCEERLPDDNKIVLVCNDAGFVHCAFYTAIGRKWYIANNTQYDSWTWEPDAMYWMPMPEPPKEVQE